MISRKAYLECCKFFSPPHSSARRIEQVRTKFLQRIVAKACPTTDYFDIFCFSSHQEYLAVWSTTTIPPWKTSHCAFFSHSTMLHQDQDHQILTLQKETNVRHICVDTLFQPSEAQNQKATLKINDDIYIGLNIIEGKLVDDCQPMAKLLIFKNAEFVEGWKFGGHLYFISNRHSLFTQLFSHTPLTVCLFFARTKVWPPLHQ